MSGYSEPPYWNKLAVAPIWLRDKFMSLIERETQHARNGKEARIVAKMNSLCDAGIIEALYEASCAGVRIDLIVRGICCYRPRPGQENLRVISIIDRRIVQEEEAQPQIKIRKVSGWLIGAAGASAFGALAVAAAVFMQKKHK